MTESIHDAVRNPPLTPQKELQARRGPVWSGTMIEALVPPGVATAVGDEIDLGGAHPAELALVDHAAPERRDHFLRGRACAHMALATVGLDGGPVLRDGRAPAWPCGAVGSITHTDGYVAAVAAAGVTCRSIGIDAEQRLPLAARVAQRVHTHGELNHHRTLDPAIPWATIAFSIKESLYKAWNPLERRWLGHRDVEVTFIDGDSAELRFLRADDASGFRIRDLWVQWAIDDSHVTSSVALLHPGTFSTRRLSTVHRSC